MLNFCANSEKSNIRIVITSYKNPEYLVNCIQSLQNQTFPNFQAIIIDDASPCEIEPHIKPFIECDARFSFKKNIKNLGGPITFMRNVATATEDYIMWLHHDDWLHNTFLEKAYRSLEDNRQCSFCYSLCSRVMNGIPRNEFPTAIRPDLSTGPHDISFDTVINCWIMWSSALIRNSAYKSIGGLDYKYKKQDRRNFQSVYRMGESDLYLFAKLSSYGEAYVINERLCYYRDHDDSNTNNMHLKSTHIQDNIRTYDEIYDEHEFFADEVRVMAKINCIGRLTLGVGLAETAYRVLYCSLLSRELVNIRANVLIGLKKSMARYILDSEPAGWPRIFNDASIDMLEKLIQSELKK